MDVAVILYCCTIGTSLFTICLMLGLTLVRKYGLPGRTAAEQQSEALRRALRLARR